MFLTLQKWKDTYKFHGEAVIDSEYELMIGHEGNGLLKYFLERRRAEPKLFLPMASCEIGKCVVVVEAVSAGNNAS